MVLVSPTRGALVFGIGTRALPDADLKAEIVQSPAQVVVDDDGLGLQH
jgi:hypothetical protein